MFFCLDSGTPLPVQFTPQDPGHYPTQIILKSVNDTRVYQIECTVSQGGLGAELEFTTPLHQSVTQDIPLVRIIFTSITTILVDPLHHSKTNMEFCFTSHLSSSFYLNDFSDALLLQINHTRQDWQMVAAVDGEGFYGPPVIVAKACMTSYYPLMFRPSAEECTEVLHGPWGNSPRS